MTLAQSYEDNDIGASTLSRKRRPAFEEMMERAWKGEFDAIIAYPNSRLTRRPMELEGFITLYNHRLRIERPLRIITVVSGEEDLSTADGRMVARFKAAADAGEAERTGERVSRARKAKRDKGHPHSVPPVRLARRSGNASSADACRHRLLTTLSALPSPVTRDCPGGQTFCYRCHDELPRMRCRAMDARMTGHLAHRTGLPELRRQLQKPRDGRSLPPPSAWQLHALRSV